MNNQNCAKALELSKIALDEVNSSSLSCIGNTVLQSSVGFTYAILKQTIEEDLLDIPVNQEKLTISDTILDKL